MAGQRKSQSFLGHGLGHMAGVCLVLTAICSVISVVQSAVSHTSAPASSTPELRPPRIFRQLAQLPTHLRPDLRVFLVPIFPSRDKPYSSDVHARSVVGLHPGGRHPAALIGPAEMYEACRLMRLLRINASGLGGRHPNGEARFDPEVTASMTAQVPWNTTQPEGLVCKLADGTQPQVPFGFNGLYKVTKLLVCKGPGAGA
ncbi:hypothetical protein LZ30DRAFT_685572 [Colletotrichum cereale]|nr:hypothetical protein LZ30DRAFT_685572 [Colletotrichum cereale]